MAGRRRPPRRDVIVAAGPPAVPIQPAAQGGQVPALFRAVADCLTAGVGIAPSAPPLATVRPREPVYRSPRGAPIHSFARAGNPFVAAALLARRYPEAPPQSPPSHPVSSSSLGGSAPRLVEQAPLPSAAPVPGSEPPPLPPSPQPAVPSLSVPTPAVPYACSYPPRLDVTDSAPPGPRGLPFPDPAYCGPRRQHPLVPGSRPPGARFGFHQPVPGIARGYWSDDEVPGTPRDPGVDWDGCFSWPQEQDGGNWGSCAPPPSPPWGTPSYGPGDYESRWRHLQSIGRCVTELSFVLDLLHDALLSREVVARDPHMNEDQQSRVRRAVESALWDVLHLPLEPGDPSLDDGPGAAAFRMVATAAEECPLGIVPALACLLRWLGRRVKRM
ncbi:unnamed protein product [Closterium sp. NIES-65]|nr:unnamed protein product [Closterium sp. NIES-65]